MTQTVLKDERLLYDQVARVVRGMIDEGSLETGQRVPSLRNMSKRLKVSITTVMQAYAHLEDADRIAAPIRLLRYRSAVAGHPGPPPQPLAARAPPGESRRRRAGHTVAGQ